MTEPSGTGDRPANLGAISTRWSAVNDPARFVVRYATAVRNYLASVLRDPNDAEDVFQEFLLGVTKNGFPKAAPGRGRFRDYLFVAVRNAALAHLRRKQSRQRREASALPALPARQDDGWLGEWHRCLLDRAFTALHHHQRHAPGNLAHTVLQVRAEHPDADSAFLAEETSRRCGRPVRADAYRQHLRRARVLLARLLVEAVGQTLEEPTPERVAEELSEVGLMRYVAPYLPPERRGPGALPALDPDR